MNSLTKLAVAVLLLLAFVAGSAAQSLEPKVYKITLIPPTHPEFFTKFVKLPKEMTKRTFFAARGTMTIYAHRDGRTNLVFDLQGLLPFGVYTFWDVLDPDFDNFKDRPLMNDPPDVDTSKYKWWYGIEFDTDGGPEGFGSFGFMADQNGRAYVTVNLDHRPGREFLLDYHADGRVRGGKVGEVVFPGVLWARFPDWEAAE